MLNDNRRAIVLTAETYFVPGTGLGPLIYAGHLGATRHLRTMSLRFPVVANEGDQWTLSLSTVQGDAKVSVTMQSPAVIDFGSVMLGNHEATSINLALPDSIQKNGEAAATVILALSVEPPQTVLQFHKLTISPPGTAADAILLAATEV